MSTIRLTGEYMDSPKARAVPGAWFDRDTKMWRVDDPTPRAAVVAMRLFPGLGVKYPELVQLRDALAQDIRPIDNATQFNRPIVAERVRAALADEGKTMFKFQELDLGYGAAVLGQHRAFYLGWERGLGKTLGAIALIEETEARRVLLVVPNTAKLGTWAPELAKWGKYLGHEVLVMPNAKLKRERMVEYIRTARHPIIVVTHYESLYVIAKMRAANRGWDRLGTWDLVVADEVHRIARLTTRMTQSLKRIPTDMRLSMSGSIIQNHAEELYSPLNWMFKEHYSSKWRDWNDRYLDYVQAERDICVGVKIERLEELRNELGVFMVYRRKEDELDLPPVTYQDQYVELAPHQRAAYDDLERTTIAFLESGETIKASDGLVMLTRLRQIATGLDLVSGELFDSSKQDAALELIKDNPDEAFVVFSWYKRAATSLANRLEAAGISTLVVTGDTKNETRASQIADFQAGAARVFIGTISTLGESVTLHRANNVIFLDRSWNPAANDQAADRVIRIGQTRPVTVTNLVASRTVDEYKLNPVLDDKSALRRIILGRGRAPESGATTGQAPAVASEAQGADRAGAGTVALLK